MTTNREQRARDVLHHTIAERDTTGASQTRVVREGRCDVGAAIDAMLAFSDAERSAQSEPGGVEERLRALLADGVKPMTVSERFNWSMRVRDALYPEWPSDGSCCRCGGVPRSPTTGICASCDDELAPTEEWEGPLTSEEQAMIDAAWERHKVAIPPQQSAPASDVLAIARDAFLNMIADATRWDEDVDGDADEYGRPVMTIDYHLTVGHWQLKELCDVLGIKAKRYDQTLKDAIDEAVAEPALSQPSPSQGSDA